MTRYRIALVLMAAAAAVAAAGCGGDDAEQAAEDAAPLTQAETAIAGATDEVATVTGEVGEALQDGLTVELAEQNGSGQSGTATFSVNDRTLHVSIMLSVAAANRSRPISTRARVTISTRIRRSRSKML